MPPFGVRIGASAARTLVEQKAVPPSLRDFRDPLWIAHVCDENEIFVLAPMLQHDIPKAPIHMRERNKAGLVHIESASVQWETRREILGHLLRDHIRVPANIHGDAIGL